MLQERGFFGTAPFIMNFDEQIPFDLQGKIDSELAGGEYLVWSGQPLPGRYARRAIPVALFGLVWTMFTVLWMTGVIRSTSGAGGPGTSGSYRALGVVFLLAGLGMLSSPYWTRRKARRIAYILTDRRAIIIVQKQLGGAIVRSFEPGQLTDLRRRENTDGSGDLVFTRDVNRDRRGDVRYTNVGFLAIRNVKSAEEKVRALVAQKSREAA